MWPGYLVAVAMFVVSLAANRIGAKGFDPLVPLLALGAWIYWLVCVHRLHSILADATGGTYPITPAKAVWGHLIPCYGFVWVFVWPRAIARFVGSRASSGMVGGWLGIPLLLSMLLNSLMGIADAPGDLLEAGAITAPFLLLQYAVGHHLTQRVRAALETRAADA
jgi:hypothetical protein